MISMMFVFYMRHQLSNPFLLDKERLKSASCGKPDDLNTPTHHGGTYSRVLSLYVIGIDLMPG